MDLYLSCLVGGAIGALVLGLSGLGIHHGAPHHHGGAATGAGHAPPTPAKMHPPARHQQMPHESAAAAWLSWCSPLFLCSGLIGFGLTGFLLRPFFAGWIRLALAFCGAYLIQRYLLRPLLEVVLQWASLPARTLDALILEQGVATTNFDPRGYGMVRVHLNGEVLQLLGRVPPEERSGSRINCGETLVVRAIDPVRQRCTVCRPHHASGAKTL